MTEATIAAINGDSYRVTDGYRVSGYLPRLASAARLTVDFEGRTVTKTPPQVGDRVLVAFAGDGWSYGYIIGFLEVDG